MVYNDGMIQLLSRAWRYENGHICATTDVFAGDRIFFYDEEWSLTRSIPGLCDTVWDHHGIQPPHTEPLFICACGNPMCTFADYFVRHIPESNAVELSDFTHMGREMHFPHVRMSHEEYSFILLKLFREFQEFETISLKVEDRDAKEGASAPLLEKILQNGRARSLYETLRAAPEKNASFSGDLRELLVKAQFSDLQRIARDFPWKLQDLHPCLYDASEVVRYKACFFLGASKLKESADVLFDKLTDESSAVSFAACRALSELQILQPFLMMDELYTRKKSRGETGGCPKSRRLSYRLRENRWLPFYLFLREGKEQDLPHVLKALEKLPLDRENSIMDEVLLIAENRAKPLALRQHALHVLKTANIHRVFPALLENFKNEKESKAFRVSLFHFLKEHSFFEIYDGFKFVRDRDEDEEIRRMCGEFLRDYSARTVFTPALRLRLWMIAAGSAALLIWRLLHFSLNGFTAAAVFFIVVFFVIINRQ